MEPRTIAIGLIAIVAAFGAAFAISSSGGGKTATAGPGTKAESIKAPAAAAVTGVEVGGTLPGLKAEKKAKKKPASENNSSSTQDTAPSTQNTAPPTQNTAPPTQNTAPPTQDTSPPPTQNNGGGNSGGNSGGGDEPVSGGGEVG